MVRRQADEARERERITQELRVARLIQQNFLPTVLPSLPGWTLGAHYRPAREVGGDFYDFVPLADGRIGIVIGDVTDKGVPAALVMATTRSLVREAVHQVAEPADVLARVNRSLHADIPANMFVTCQYALVDPASGELVLANAGHPLPYLHRAGMVSEVRMTGLPLGMMPGAKYDQLEVVVPPGAGLLFHSDGLAEAHAPDGEMFGTPRLMGLVGKHPGGLELIDMLLGELAAFTGPAWEVEDDVTLVTAHRAGAGSEARQVLDEFTAPSAPGNELDVARRVVAAVGSLLTPQRRERLQTAVAEAAMNAMEHGNGYRPDLDVKVAVVATGEGVVVAIGDHGAGGDIPAGTAPDLVAKLAGTEPPRGWGLFLVRQMVDDVSTRREGGMHVIELTMRRDGGGP
jgi:anti-sigma regulatory factor (Ser/Thr protein kinase)